MNKEIKRVVTASFLSLLLLTFISPCVFAGSGNGTGGGAGNGTGGKSDIALTIISSSIKSGETDVPLNPVMDIQFNKNVVNLTVKSNNSRCFHLVDQKGKNATIKIIFPDDQIRQEYREHIFITPKQNLSPNTKYTLYIDKTLKAKNKKLIDNAHIITFTTGKTATTAVNASLKDLGDDIETYTNKLTPKSGTQIKKPITTAKKTALPVNNNSLSLIITAAVLAVVILLIILFILSRRRNRGNH